MSQWPSTKARIVYRALLKNGWTFVRQVGSHRKLQHSHYPAGYTWAFADNDELGHTMLSRIAKRTGLKPSDL
ncbi:MAG TPA: type II toxin-antitoxin system HicA family toxin [Candidatus Sulfotelmatobacter sp.]